MKLAEKILNLNEGYAFEISDEPYNSDGNYGEDDVKKLCKLLGLEHIKTSYGYGKAKLNGHAISLTVDRHKPVIVLYADAAYDKRVRIKDGLTSVQIKNLRKKLDKQIKELEDSQNKYANLSSAREVLSKKGIVTSSGDTITVDGVNIGYDNDKLSVYDTVGYNGYLSFKADAVEKEIDKALANVKKSILSDQKKYLDALKKAEKNSKIIKDYFDIQGK